MIQAVQMEYKQQVYSISHGRLSLRKTVQSQQQRERGSEPEKREQASEKQDSRTERTVILLLNREPDQGVSLGFQDWDIDPKLLSGLRPLSSSGITLGLFSSLNPEEKMRQGL